MDFATRSVSRRPDFTRENINAASTVVMAFATVALFIAAILQWKTLEKTDLTLRAEQRAWIAPRGITDPIPPNFINKVDKYSELLLRLENVGKGPAVKTNELVIATTVKKGDLFDEAVILKTIRDSLAGRECENIPVDPKGRAIYPGGTPGRVLALTDPQVAKVNAGSDFALVIGCIVYQTLEERHYTKLCMIAEPPIASEKWRSTNCRFYNDAN